MIKLIASDLDGTLLESENSIIGKWPNGSTFTAEFDENNRYIKGEIKMLGNN